MKFQDTKTDNKIYSPNLKYFFDKKKYIIRDKKKLN